MKPLYYRRDGTPYKNCSEWARDFESQDRTVRKTSLPWDWKVSTVWVGLDHSFGVGSPLIFETMVFDERGESIDMARYPTEESALAGHEKMVAKWQSKKGKNNAL